MRTKGGQHLPFLHLDASTMSEYTIRLPRGTFHRAVVFPDLPSRAGVRAIIWGCGVFGVLSSCDEVGWSLLELVYCDSEVNGSIMETLAKTSRHTLVAMLCSRVVAVQSYERANHDPLSAHGALVVRRHKSLYGGGQSQIR